MGKRTNFTTRDYIEQAVLPSWATTYTCIPHKDIIDKTHELLANSGFVVENELYRCNQRAEIASGIYHIKTSDQDQETTMMFAWSNSYDKSMRFKCSVGARILMTSSYMISGDIASSWSRKHTGNALQEAIVSIQNQLTGAGAYYSQLIKDKEEMKLITLDGKPRAELLGRLLFEQKLLTMEQGSYIKTGLLPDMTNTRLWDLYMVLTEAMKKAHPRLWLDAQRQLHAFICQEYGIGGLPCRLPIVGQVYQDTEQVDPAQINLLDSIEEITAERDKPGKAELDFTL